MEGSREGPFTLEELRHDSRVTPDTLVWKEGFPRWIPIRKIPELKELFVDPVSQEELSEEEEEKKKTDFLQNKGNDELAIDIDNEPPTLLFWIIVVAMLFAYMMYKLSQL